MVLVIVKLIYDDSDYIFLVLVLSDRHNSHTNIPQSFIVCVFLVLIC